MNSDRLVPGGTWPLLASALILVAGALHLLLAPNHLATARGAGLFFIVLGIAQVVWAMLFALRPSKGMAWIGIAAMVAAPVLLYILTRILPAPWHGSPEGLDTMSMATQIVEIMGGLAILVACAPGLLDRKMAAVAAVGLLLGAGAYAVAMQSENVEWLSEPEEAHGHGAEALAPGSGFGIRGESVVKSIGYYGPQDAVSLQQTCKSMAPRSNFVLSQCYTTFLKDLLVAEGSVVAYELLADLIAVDTEVDRDGHTYAHDLGRFAYQAYGYDITLTLATCSYEVFQGCLHGALQFFFDDLAGQGKKLDATAMRTTCSAAKTSFESYACLHGLGHGVMLYTNYAIHDSLDYCAKLETYVARESCHGGVFMENWVGYQDSLSPTSSGGHQGHGGHSEPPTFWINKAVPEYPCNIVEYNYQDACWAFQTSLILNFNGGNFAAAKEICETKSGDFRLTCWRSIGRDAGAWANRDAAKMVEYCMTDDMDALGACVDAFSVNQVLTDNDPNAGFAICEAIPDWLQRTCLHAVTRQSIAMLGEAKVADLCDMLLETSIAPCHEGINKTLGRPYNDA